MVATMASYLEQLGVSARSTTVSAYEQGLRHFAGQVTEADPTCTSMATVERRHIEAHKLWLAARPGKAGKPLAAVTIRHRLGLLRTFFERLRDWDYDDAPSRTLIFPGDFPQADEPLPKFLDDPTMEKFRVALASDPNPRRRLMVEILAQTGIRAGELAGLTDDAVTMLGNSVSLRIPVGKTAQRPLRAVAATDGRADRQLSKAAGTEPIRTPARAGRWSALRPAHHPSLRRPSGQASRLRTRPSPPTPPHHGHPVHQPGHESGGDRRPARSPLHAHDADLCPDLEPNRR
jgi:integrase